MGLSLALGILPSVLALNTGSYAVDIRSRPFCIGVAGGTASGKTTVVEKLVQRIRDNTEVRVASITQDCFYKPLSSSEREQALASNYNFDHPDAFDFDLTVQVLQHLHGGDPAPVAVPQYDFCSHSRLSTDHDTLVEAPQVVIFEGILALHDERLRALLDLKIFVDADDDIRLARRIQRDIAERGRDLAGVLMQYEKFVKPAFDSFIRPTKCHADIVVPRGGDNTVAIELLAQHVATLLPANPEPLFQGGHADPLPIEQQSRVLNGKAYLNGCNGQTTRNAS